MSDVATRREGARPSIVVARVASVVITALYFFFVARTGQASVELAVLVFLLGLAALASLVAWYDAARGAIALAVIGLTLAVFGAVAASHDQVYVAALLGVPYLITAALLGFGSARTRSA